MIFSILAVLFFFIPLINIILYYNDNELINPSNFFFWFCWIISGLCFYINDRQNKTNYFTYFDIEDSDERKSTVEKVSGETTTEEISTKGKTIDEKLNELKSIYEKNLIDESEFKLKKQELINEI